MTAARRFESMLRARYADDASARLLEHKLLSEVWLDWMGGTSRETVDFEVPDGAASGDVSRPVEPIPIGKALVTREGGDVAMISAGVGVHRCLAAAEDLEAEGVNCAVVDLRTISPLDTDAVCEAARRCGKVLVVDEDYLNFGLSGEVAAVVAEAGLAARYTRVGVTDTLPYSLELESEALPTTDSIAEAARGLL